MTVAIFKRILVVMSMLAVSLSCSGRDAPGGGAVRAYELSLASFEKAKSDLERAIDECDGARKVIAPSLITPFGMDIKDVELALYVLNRRAEERCERGARERLFYRANVHIRVAEHYGRDAGDANDYSGDLLFIRHWEYLELEAKYLELDENVRKGLESIKELKVPITLFETIDGVKASMQKNSR